MIVTSNMSIFDHLIPQRVAEATARIHGIAHVTPVLTSRTLNARAGSAVFLKCENLQRVGAFKFRGAYNAVSRLDDGTRAKGVITHSSGNHAQGLALASKLLGVPCTIVMPDNAPAAKKAATAGYGATIVQCAPIDRERVALQLAQANEYTLIHPYDNGDIIAGAGTAAWELFDQVGELDYLFVPVGGGGLISGSALAAAERSPGCRVIGVEPESADDANQSWRSGTVATLDVVPDTLADGLRTRFIGERNLFVMQRYVSDMTTVSESAIQVTLRFVWERMKIIIEPSSAVALAPVLLGTYPVRGRVGVLISGGNVSWDVVCRFLSIDRVS